jgi:steroid delta-isomerase-like uncharacterized protein
MKFNRVGIAWTTRVALIHGEAQAGEEGKRCSTVRQKRRAVRKETRMPYPTTDSLGARTREEMRTVLEPYLAALALREDVAPYLADDVVLTLVEAGQEIRGRETVARAITELHQVTFDARPEISNLVVDEGQAAGEFVFVGTHTSEFAGIPATGRAVRVPYTVFYDLVDGAIAALRILGFASGLVAQLEAAPTTAAKSSSRQLPHTGQGDTGEAP